MNCKHILSTFLLITFVGFTAFAQQRNDLKGPAAKNYDVWSSEKQNTLNTITQDVSPTFIPNKNRIAIGDEKVSQPIARKEREERRGLRSKNRNPFRD